MKLVLAFALLCAAFAGAPNAAFAQSAAGEAWALATDRAYAFEKPGVLKTYRLGTSNAKFLLKGAKKVPNGTLFFVGENGQLYMRAGRYLEDDGSFSFGPS